jgi:RNA polymerase sigma factor (sigma-70 family)
MHDTYARMLDQPAQELYRELRLHARSAMRDHADADDVAQESWARVVAAVAKNGPVANVRAYLFRVARNLVIDHHRREKARPEEAMPPERFADIADVRPNAEAQLVTRDELRRMDAIIAAMPAKARLVFCLSRIEGLSFAEIGRRTGVSRQTVHDHMTRALLAIQLAAEADY